jgi:DNA-directed RNA polymerase specialized sigma24 family protein
MNEPFQVKDFQRHLSGEQRSIPAGVMQAVLMHALQLRRSCREVFLLCDIQRHSLEDAAMILGISQAVAKRRLRLARQRMNDVIERLCGPIRDVAGPTSE